MIRIVVAARTRAQLVSISLTYQLRPLALQGIASRTCHRRETVITGLSATAVLLCASARQAKTADSTSSFIRASEESMSAKRG
jgi:hypothetical protein